ncbi:MAG: YggS family pyridoxal phosphate-dependent enzyme, partial [Pseudomonadota bacterium]|nr:YggS family pyridoxal phosphate-dependent enzyme [Pseudomonadota bacterium]
IAVSKKQSLEKIRALHALGIQNFAENFAQEAVERINQLDLKAVWHFIGNIQSNKTKLIANHFDWVHSITRYKIAERLNNQRKREGAMNVCIQVKLDENDARESVKPIEVRKLMDEMQNLEKIKLRGLMAISSPKSSLEEKNDDFRRLNQLYKELIIEGHEIDTLSMGMSDDYKIAIQNGSNMIRIGTSLFGKRDY